MTTKNNPEVVFTLPINAALVVPPLLYVVRMCFYSLPSIADIDNIINLCYTVFEWWQSFISKTEQVA